MSTSTIARTTAALAVGLGSLLVAGAAPAQDHGGGHAAGDDPNRITDEYIPLQTEGYPARPVPLLELGNPFLDTGPISEPFRSPTGAIWTPSLLVWGNFRSGFAGLDRGNDERAVWANRLDLFLEGRVSPTERIVLGMRPLDDRGEFTGYDFKNSDGLDGTNGRLQTAFIEGDFGEIFPGLDEDDSRALDYGFGLGRQPVTFQDGILVNDIMDSVTLTRNSLRFWGMSNFLATAIVAWNDIERGNAVLDDDALLFGLMTASDFEASYVQVDVLMAKSSDDTRGDGLYLGVGATQRIGTMNSTFRVNTSQALDEDNAAVRDGVLFTAELSWVPHHTHDNFYVGAFAALDEFTSAARAPATGGPVAGTGILFAATGLGSVGAPLSSRANDVIGGAVGYQQFLDHGRRQLVYELAGRSTTKSGRDDSTLGIGTRYQTAWGRHAVFFVDVFAGLDEVDDEFFGGRLELNWKF